MKSRRNLVIALCAAILVIVCAGSFLFWNSSPPPEPAGGSPAGAVAGQSSADGQPTAGTDGSLLPGAIPPAAAEQAEIARKLGELAEKMANGTAVREPDTRTEPAMAEARRRAAEDPKSAFAWAFQQGDMARMALGIVLETWARTDPAAAFEALREPLTGSDPHLRSTGLALVTEQWNRADPAAVWKAIGTLPPSVETAFLKARAADAWAGKDLTGAAAALKALTSGARNRDEQVMLQPAFSTVANRLALQDGTKAAEWALSFAEGSPERVNAVAGLVPGWYEKDPKAVCDWLNGLTEGPAHDAGAAALVTICTGPAPEIALQWAQNISDETQRSALTAQVASRWLAADPEKAGAWMEKTTVLTTEQREMILMHDRMFRNVSGAARNGR